MKLTHRDAWHQYAGGTCAASDRHGYTAVTSIGKYDIQPVSSPHNVERHIGYRVTFINDLGKLSGGLYQQIRKELFDLITARRMCQHHMELWATLLGSAETPA